jgi:hypothetical protein
MYGLASEHMFHGRVREAARVASEQMALLESIGDPAMTIGVAFLTLGVKLETGEMHDILRLAQTVIDWADGDPLKGNIILGSPLAVALLCGQSFAPFFRRASSDTSSAPSSPWSKYS